MTRGPSNCRAQSMRVSIGTYLQEPLDCWRGRKLLEKLKDLGVRNSVGALERQLPSFVAVTTP